MFFPIRDHNPSSRIPFVTYALLAANILIFISYLGLFSDPRALGEFYQTWGLVPAKLSQGGGYHGLITSMFLHGGIWHLVGNMLFLWVFGDNVEDAMGHIKFLLFYLACGVFAGLTHAWIDPTSEIPLIGASGAVAGVIAASNLAPRFEGMFGVSQGVTSSSGVFISPRASIPANGPWKSARKSVTSRSA